VLGECSDIGVPELASQGSEEKSKVRSLIVGQHVYLSIIASIAACTNNKGAISSIFSVVIVS
jgi:hypothetical protein